MEGTLGDKRIRFLLLALILILAACGTGEPAQAPSNATDGVTAGVAAVTEATIVIGKQAFQPHTLIAATGATVTWQNDDSVAHTITSGSGWFDSGQLSPGDSFVHQFDKPGTYRYQCTNHPAMEGVIVVLPGGAVAPLPFEGKVVEIAFRDSCSGCHGPNREGATGPALIPARLGSGDDYYFDIIKEGKPGTVMPAWGPTGMTDEEIWALVGYIRSEPTAESVEWGLEQVAASREDLVDEATLPSEPSHDGNLDNLMLVTEREARSIAVFDGDSHRLLGHIPASYRAHGYAFDPTSDRWAYNVGRDGWLFKIDLYTLQAVTRVRVGLDSRGLAISDDGQYVIVGNYIPNSAVILDAKTLEPLKVITTEGENPQGEFVASRVCITSDVSPEKVGPYFILALKEAGQMWRIDYSKPDFPIDKVEGVGNILHDGFLSPDNKSFYIASQVDNWMKRSPPARHPTLARAPPGWPTARPMGRRSTLGKARLPSGIWLTTRLWPRSRLPVRGCSSAAITRAPTFGPTPSLATHLTASMSLTGSPLKWSRSSTMAYRPCIPNSRMTAGSCMLATGRATLCAFTTRGPLRRWPKWAMYRRRRASLIRPGAPRRWGIRSS
jgi:plastocyanin